MRRREHRTTSPNWPTCRRILASILFLSLFSAGAFAQKKAAARAQYERADKQRTALEGKPQKERALKEYTQLVAAFRRVYHLSPQAAEVTSSLLAVGELYQEMGRLFDEKYFQSAVDAYQFLLHEYPASRYRDDALFTIAQIQQEDLGDLDLAEKTYQEFLNRFPRSSKAEQAKEALAEIAAEREKEKKASSKAALAEERARERKIPQVSGIRHWNAEHYTRIVISVDSEVKYQAARIANPDRIYFDIYKAKLGSTLAGKTLEVQSGFLKTIRVAQNQSGVVRVVLEVDKVKDYSVFLLPDPYRMVVDIYGEHLATTKAEPPKTEEPPSTPLKKADAPLKNEKESARAAKAKKGPKEAPQAESAEPVVAAAPKKDAETEKPAWAERTANAKREAPSKAAGPLVAATPAVPTRNGQMDMTRVLGLKIGRIVIDAGHGGHDTGTIGPTGLMEKDLCLDVALRLGRMIQERLVGMEVLYTREDDTFVPLENRTAIANQSKADLFLSIHANSSRDKSARGIETYYLNFAASGDALEVAARENALSQGSIHELQDLIKKIAKNEKIEESREFALEIQEHLAKRLQKVSRSNKSRGVKKAPFVVLIGANMPSVLAEISFISNPTDETLLKKGEHRNRVVEGLYHGIEKYLQNLNSLSFNSAKPDIPR
ncbi:MAG: N-acetylmuramoyl-L-alanine amidase [Acidobacteria bacterium]|nr:N-acetylmuramoyl-L-alanine amidase [Acidobacteriota bacterium]MBI3663674.1 N-acetylmuramoyl-L-alanine amidase [Acidobacteriota bacterium]